MPSEDPKRLVSREMARTNIMLLDLSDGRVTRVANRGGSTAAPDGEDPR